MIIFFQKVANLVNLQQQQKEQLICRVIMVMQLELSSIGTIVTFWATPPPPKKRII